MRASARPAIDTSRDGRRRALTLERGLPRGRQFWSSRHAMAVARWPSLVAIDRCRNQFASLEAPISSVAIDERQTKSRLTDIKQQLECRKKSIVDIIIESQQTDITQNTSHTIKSNGDDRDDWTPIKSRGCKQIKKRSKLHEYTRSSKCSSALKCAETSRIGARESGVIKTVSGEWQRLRALLLLPSPPPPPLTRTDEQRGDRQSRQRSRDRPPSRR